MPLAIIDRRYDFCERRLTIFAGDPRANAARVKADAALKQIKKNGDQVLRQRSEEVEVGPYVSSIIDHMARVAAPLSAAGLAAPQLGYQHRIILFRDPDAGQRSFTPLINPVIESKSDTTNVENEECLSLPGRRVAVERANDITVTAIDVDGEPLRFALHGLAARIVQHEVDHLDGVLITDYRGGP